jgi:glycosyltransferase involved in cell wall biosynthesis
VNVGIVVHNFHRLEGTGGYVWRLLPYLARRHEVTLYAARIREPVPDGVTVVEVPALMLRAATAMVTFPRAFARVRRPHDLVHTQGWVTDRADVVTAHIVLAAWRQAIAAAGMRPALGERLVSPYAQRKEARLYARGARHVIAPSRKIRDELAAHYGRTADVTVVPHGFPAARIPHPAPSAQRPARKHLGLPLDVPIALYAGSLRKGFGVAVDAVAAHGTCHLAVVTRAGDPSDIERARQTLGRRFHSLGAVSPPDDAYRAADLLVHPTIYDAFGLVVAEAMAFGVPPVVSANAGITDLIEHGVSGWVVSGDVVRGTATAIQRIVDDEALRQRLGRGALGAAQRRQWELVAEETMAVYEQVASA